MCVCGAKTVAENARHSILDFGSIIDAAIEEGPHSLHHYWILLLLLYEPLATVFFFPTASCNCQDELN